MNDIKIRTRPAQEAFCRLALGLPDLMYMVMHIALEVYKDPLSGDLAKDCCADVKRDLQLYVESLNDTIALYNASLLYPIKGTSNHILRVHNRADAVDTTIKVLLGTQKKTRQEELLKDFRNGLEEIRQGFIEMSRYIGTIASNALVNDTLRSGYPCTEIMNQRLPMLDIEE